MAIFTYFVIAPLLFTVISAAPEQLIKNAAGVVVAEVIDGRIIHLINRHRNPSSPKLQFSVHPPVVETIKPKANSPTTWILHLNDNTNAELSVIDKGDNTEFSFLWHGGGPNGERDICFSYAYNGAKWYNGYQSMNSTWPLRTDRAETKQAFNFLMDYDRFNSRDKDKEDILVLEQLFLNTDGFALSLDHQQPLFINRKAGVDPQMCFTVANVPPYNVNNHDATYLDLKFKIFASKNIRAVTDYVVHDSALVPKVNAMPDESVFRHPTWFLWEMNHYETQHGVDIFLNETLQHGFATEHSQLVLDFWESDYGNYTFSKRYPKPDEMLNSLTAHNFAVGVPFYGPFLNVNHTVETEKLFVKNSKTGKISNIVDFSNPQAAKLYHDRLTALLGPKKIDILHLFPHFTIGSDFVVFDPVAQKYPSILTTRYLEAVQKLGKKIVISEFAFNSQHLPIFTRLTNNFRESYVQQLREIVADVLSVSVAGYSFIIPYSAGGFYSGFKPSEEEFIRMVQAITFMPAMSFTRKPWQYSNKTIDLTKNLLKLHAEHVPTIMELAKKRLSTGSPIIRPLWYLSPDDAKTYAINDQFLLGDDILVAPVLEIGQRERSVYFPAGTWVDQHGKSYTGPSQTNLKAPLEELPYFKRKH